MTPGPGTRCRSRSRGRTATSTTPSAPAAGEPGAPRAPRGRACRRCGAGRRWRPPDRTRARRSWPGRRWSGLPPHHLRCNARDRVRQPQLPAHRRQGCCERADQGAGTAAGEGHPPLPLQEVDQRVDGAGVEGIAADQEGVEAQRLAQVLVLHEARDRGVDRAVGPEAHELRCHPHHVREAQERNAGQLLISLLEDPPGVVDEGTVAGHVRRRAALDLLLHRLGVPGVVEGVSVGPAQAVEGRDRQELDLVAPARGRRGRRAPRGSPGR